MVVVIVATLIATVTDVWKYKVYNALTLPLLAFVLFAAAVLANRAG